MLDKGLTLKPELTAARLRELLHYDPETGVFTRLTRSAQKVKVGEVAGGLDCEGYLKLSVDGRRYQAHRLAWLYVHGIWPERGIDHRNGQRSDNRMENLRAATQGENLQNRSLQSIGVSGRLGVGWDAKRCKWVASIKKGGKSRFLGRYDSVDKASAAYLAAKAEQHEFNPIPRA